jgi:hydroxymethylglutaryl-CoA reductase (NADPH)
MANVSHMTIGMHLDALLERMDSLSSTELYGIIVLFTVGISFLLLGSGGSAVDDVVLKEPQQKIPSMKPKGRQPKWHILKWLNYAAIVGFVASVAKAVMHASGYLEDSFSLVQYLVGWSLFLCYFFGFFGISFIDADELAMAGRTEEHTAPASNNAPTKSAPKKSVHPAARSAPVCSDPASLKGSSFTANIKDMSDEDVCALVLHNKIKDHELEKRLDPHRAVTVRRLAFDAKLSTLGHAGALDTLPSSPSLDYSRVYGANCEIVVGYVPLPVGMVGPLTLNGETVYIPMATTEGCLVASTNRGAKAISQGSGAHAMILKDGITRAPCVRMNSAREAAELYLWCTEPENFATLKRAFESTTSFGKLKSCVPTVAGKNVYLRLVCFAGDAMGMNMVSKGSLAVIEVLQSQFPSLQLVALSGNMCTDKKAAATNWIEGRGKSVVVEATIPEKVVRSTLKTTVKAICDTNLQKNLVGSAMAGTVGGFNAHASNIVTAVFLATGQDPAQNVESSNCITLMEETTDGDLWISCTMPSIEVGTVGGGTSLEAQSACLAAIGVKGGCKENPGENARKLATVVAAATMAGELSLLAALAANTLVQAHMTHNRKPAK